MVNAKPVFYPDTLGLGEIASIGEGVGGLGAVPPAGSTGRAPGQGGWGRSPPPLQKLEAFCCISSLFLSILEGIVEL